MFNLNSEPVRIAKTKCGKTIKVYDQVNDWQTFIIGAKFPELWKTNTAWRMPLMRL